MWCAGQSSEQGQLHNLWGLLLKNVEEFQDGDSGALKEVWWPGVWGPVTLCRSMHICLHG